MGWLMFDYLGGVKGLGAGDGEIDADAVACAGVGGVVAVAMPGLEQEEGGNQGFLAAAFGGDFKYPVVQRAAFAFAAFVHCFLQLRVVFHPLAQGAWMAAEKKGDGLLTGPLGGGVADDFGGVAGGFAGSASYGFAHGARARGFPLAVFTVCG